jgi:hypothetical protein
MNKIKKEVLTFDLQTLIFNFKYINNELFLINLAVSPFL